MTDDTTSHPAPEADPFDDSPMPAEEVQLADVHPAIETPASAPSSEHTSTASDTESSDAKASPTPASDLSDPAGTPGRRAIELVLLLFCIGVMVAPIWYFKYFPTTDGASHVANAEILKDFALRRPGVFADYYQIVKRPERMTNIIGHVVMMALMLAVKPVVAEKILLTLYALGLPLAFRYALGAIKPSARVMAFLILPFVMGYLFHMGFYNFSISLIMYFVVVGYWWRCREHFTLGRSVVFTLLMGIAFVCHVVAVFMAALTIGTLAMWLTMYDVTVRLGNRPFEFRNFCRGFLSRVGVPLYAALPILLLSAIWFLDNRGFGYRDNHTVQQRIRQRVQVLQDFDIVTAYQPAERYLAWTLAAAMAALIGYQIFLKLRDRRIAPWDGLFGVALAMTALFLVIAEKLYITHRINLYAVLTMAFWLGVQKYPRRARMIVPAAFAAIAIGFVAMRWNTYKAYNSAYAEYFAVARMMPRDSVFLPITISDRGLRADGSQISEIAAFNTASAYVAAENHLVDLRGNYEASTPFFPIHALELRDPYKFIAHERFGFNSDYEKDPPDDWDRMSFLEYPATGGRIDYVLVYGLTPEKQKLKKTQDVLGELKTGGYILIKTSADGRTQLYRAG